MGIRSKYANIVKHKLEPKKVKRPQDLIALFKKEMKTNEKFRIRMKMDLRLDQENKFVAGWNGFIIELIDRGVIDRSERYKFSGELGEEVYNKIKDGRIKLV